MKVGTLIQDGANLQSLNWISTGDVFNFSISSVKTVVFFKDKNLEGKIYLILTGFLKGLMIQKSSDLWFCNINVDYIS